MSVLIGWYALFGFMIAIGLIFHLPGALALASFDLWHETALPNLWSYVIVIWWMFSVMLAFFVRKRKSLILAPLTFAILIVCGLLLVHICHLVNMQYYTPEAGPFMAAQPPFAVAKMERYFFILTGIIYAVACLTEFSNIFGGTGSKRPSSLV